MTPTPSVPPSAVAGDSEAAAALQDALAAEHAAVWVFTLVPAFLPAELIRPAADAAAAHRTRRDAVTRWLTDADRQPVAALPAYRTPQPVTDRRSAAALAVVAEGDAMAAWRSVLERAADPALRRSALAYLTESAVRAAPWRAEAGLAPPVPPFPGAP